MPIDTMHNKLSLLSLWWGRRRRGKVLLLSWEVFGLGWGPLFHHVLTEMKLKEELFGVWVPLHPEPLFSFVNLSTGDLWREGGRERKKKRGERGRKRRRRGKEEERYRERRGKKEREGGREV